MAEQQEQNPWALVISGGRSYIGREVEDPNLPDNVICLSPCFEYISELQFAMDNKGSIAGITGRTRMLMPFDHTLGQFPVRIVPNLVAYVDEMAEGDREKFMEMINKTVEATEARRRSVESGVRTASLEDVQKYGGK